MVKAKGIVIRTTDYGESNKILTLYTADFGKIGLMARGARKPRSTLSGVSHVLFYGMCLFNRGRGLGSLYQAESIHTFRGIMADIRSTAYAALILELLDRLTEDNKPFPGLYRLLRDTLVKIDKGTDAAVLAAIFSIKLMRIAGIDPQVDHCLKCGEKKKSYRFSISGGGFLCPDCAQSDPYAIPMTLRASTLISLFKRIPLERIGTVSVKPDTIREIEALIAAYYEQNAGIKCRSRRFIEQLSHFKADNKSSSQ
jgi:DNA repair protein RecO (recombination protein O)